MKANLRMKLIVGCGYLGSELARAWRAEGHAVTAWVRTPARRAALEQLGAAVWVQDLYGLEKWPEPVRFDTIVFAVSFSSGAIHTGHVPALERLMDSCATMPRRFIYISSTGVYGDDKPWVDESSPCAPRRTTSRWCWEAEQFLGRSPVASGLIVLRMAGLYGPGRVPRLEDLRQQRPLAADPDGWLNLIHLYDAVQVVLAAEQSAPVPRVYNVADGHPVRRRDFLEEVARVFHTPPPRFIAPDPDDPRQARSLASRRVSIQRLQQELAVRFRYPSYREGLAAIAQRDG
ncbi:MAG: hypothetical protein KatS3mg110_1071 [Pirellulaceae bacterium]|nr:MAG: hypothetical protein KatS3mg110_1071 [Pirellulaceae bacterium]